jgi:hypothetical protein
MKAALQRFTARLRRFADGLERLTASLQTIAPALPPVSRETLDKLAIVQEALLSVEQVPVATEHLLHGGMYARTIRLQAGAVMVGSLMKLATVLIVNGYGSALAGEDRIDLEGYNVMPGSAGRKLLFVARGPVEMTMIFPTQARTVEEAENEVCAEAHLLMSRKDGRRDTVTITGE